MLWLLLVQELPLAELIKPPDEDFAPTMIASLKERVAVVEETVKMVANGMETVPEEGDFDAVCHRPSNRRDRLR